MSVEEQTQTLKRGRPKKIKTQEEIDSEKQKKREIKQKWYQEHKNDIQQQHKKYYIENKDKLNNEHKQNYYEKQDELKTKSKSLQTKYRDSYRFLCKLVEEGVINSSYPKFNEIKNIVQ